MSRLKTARERNAARNHYAILGGAELPAQEKERIIYRRRTDIPSEHQEQSVIVNWWALVYAQYSLPEFALQAVPNGGARSAVTGALLKAEGVRAGSLDLQLLVPRGRFHGLVVEVKRMRDSKTSPEQRAMVDFHRSQGYQAHICQGADAAITVIKSYLVAPFSLPGDE